MEIFFSLLIIGLFIVSFCILIGYIFKAIGFYTIAKRRGINNPWLAFIPLAQEYIMGDIYDNINAYKFKQTNYKILLLVLVLITSTSSGYTNVSMFALSTFLFWVTSIVSIVFRVFSLIAIFNIFKEYSPKNAVLFLVLSICLYVDFIFIFAIRKNVPVTMCFAPQDEWMFEANRPRLQSLWNQFHSIPQMQSWEQFLMANFTPA